MPSENESKPQYSPTPRELDDVELLRMGALPPHLGPDDDVTFVVPAALADKARAFGELEVIDPEGVPLAIVTIDDIDDRTDGTCGVVGAVRSLPGQVRRAFGDLYVPPSVPRTELDAGTLTVAVSAALTADDVSEIASLARGRSVLFLVLAGHGTPVGLSRHGLIRATKRAASQLPESRVIAAPVAAREEPAADASFRERVVRAYAPGADVHWPTGTGAYDAGIQSIVEADRPTGADQGLVVFFTGLSGSGKSTIAQALRDRVLEHGERTVTLLDGDRVRRNLSKGLTYSREDRETNIRRIGWVAAEIAAHGGFVICSPIAPFDTTRKIARSMVADSGAAFVLVHLATPLSECELRDRKGLYAKARRGEVEEFTGISSPYEIPQDAEISVDTTGRSVVAVLDEVLDHLVDHGWLTPVVLSAAASPANR